MTNNAKGTAGHIRSVTDGVKYALDKLGGISLLTIFRTFLVVLNIMVILFLYNIVTSQQTVEKIIDSIIETNKEEQIDMSIRDHVSPQIMNNLKKLVYSVDADRAFVIELHNGKKNATSLPFKFFDMTYEEVNEDRQTPYIAQNFVSIMVSHYKLPYWLVDNTIFMGTTEELMKIDTRFATNFEEYKGKYIAVMILRNNGQEIGFIGISYDYMNHVKPEDELKQKLMLYGRIVAPLLDLGAQKLKLNLNKNEE